MVNKEFGINIKRLRQQIGYTQTELAKHSGLHRSFISGVEKGERNITLETIAKIASALSVPIADLFSSHANDLDIIDSPKPVSFLKLGGTWDMVETKDGLMGKGNLDDQELHQLEEKTNNELSLMHKLKTIISQTKPLTQDIGSHLFWAKDINKLITGEFIPVFSSDSSNYRNSLFAVVTEYIFSKLQQNPQRQILIGMGTDTTDILLPLLDAFLFDKQLPAVLVTGANRSHQEKHSDAPGNFVDLATTAHLPLLPGAYYVFHHVIYRGGDLAKIDPSEEPTAIEGQTTFFAPNRTHSKIGFLQNGGYRTKKKFSAGNLSQFTAEKIFKAMNSIVTIDLGDTNAIETEIAKMNNRKHKAIVIKSHALGNVPLPIKNAAMTAVSTGKIVLNVSRCLIANTSNRYALSLSHASSQIINGNKLNPKIAKALLLRSLLEGKNLRQTQELINLYLKRTF